MKKILILALALCMILSVAAFAVSCDTAGEEQTSESETEKKGPDYETFKKDEPDDTEAEADKKVTYTITVKNADGAPVAGVNVQVCVGDTCKMPKNTDASGVVKFDIEETDEALSVQINSVPEGYEIPAKTAISSGETNVTITLNNK